MASGPYDPRPSDSFNTTDSGSGEPRYELPSAPHRRQPWQEASVPLMEQVFEGQSVADPGTPKRRRWNWVLAVVLILLTVTAQQWKTELRSNKPSPVPTVEPVEKQTAQPAPTEPLGVNLDAPDLMGRLMVKAGHALGAAEYAKQIDPAQHKIREGIKLVPAYAELSGTKRNSATDVNEKRDAAVEAIEELQDRLSAGTEVDADKAKALKEDLDALHRLYSEGTAKLAQADRDRIEHRLGWQGRLALTFDLPENDPGRQALLANGGGIVVFLLLAVLGVCAALFSGFVLFIVAIVLLVRGKLTRRLDQPQAGGSLGVEVLTVFLATFLGLQIVLTVIAAGMHHGWFGAAAAANAEHNMMIAALILQWVVLPVVVLYPSWRGYKRGRVKRALGWHSGRGFFIEVLCGIAGYLSLLPVYLVGLAISLILIFVQGMLAGGKGEEPPAPANPYGDILSNSWTTALLMFALATIWAPFVEETVFRGGMFRQLLPRMKVFWAALICGVVFTIMHPYPPALFPPLIVLGTGFALIRWWRGSLVGCIAAHALHNFTLMVVTLTLFTLLK